jgi:PAS domain-containing protein
MTEGAFGVVQLALLGEAVDALDGVAVFVWNEERRYVAVNDEACTLVGRSREQILGMEVGDMSPDRATPMVERTRHSPLVLGSSVIHRPDGDVPIEWITCHSVVANLPYMVSLCWRKGAAGRFPPEA